MGILCGEELELPSSHAGRSVGLESGIQHPVDQEATGLPQNARKPPGRARRPQKILDRAHGRGEVHDQPPSGSHDTCHFLEEALGPLDGKTDHVAQNHGVVHRGGPQR